MPFLPSRRLTLSAGMAASVSALMPGAPAAAKAHRFEIGPSDFLLDGRPIQIRCGEMHFPRVPREYWPHRLKMIKAMGLNAVCAYLFWNYHEWNEGQFDWEGQKDAAAFCRMAQKEGLWVILRPGPYACAEWEMGGLPWWLLKAEGDAFLRTRAEAFTGPAHRWIEEVGRHLGPLQVTKGGPILMVQVENEYGFFGNDLEYLQGMRKAVERAGFDVPLFQCNPTHVVAKTHIPELLSVANFGNDPEAGFNALRSVQRAPLMCGEYYSGWFDVWGAGHRTGGVQSSVADIKWMLQQNGSFSLYMAHGGTSFGLWGGCDRPFQPDTTSYDYDAPISEAGRIGEKFEAYRSAMRPFLKAGERLPAPPPQKNTMALAPFTLEECAPVSAGYPSDPVRTRELRSIEAYGISRGLVSYRAVLPAGPEGVLKVNKARDLAWIRVDGKEVGTFDVRHQRTSVAIPARSRDAVIEILLYTIARVNFGVEVHDRKGLQGPVTFTPKGSAPMPVENWELRAIDFGANGDLPKLNWTRDKASGPSFYRGTFTATSRDDTFLNLSNWGLGIVWINGRCLGRYWSIGPTQTMYLPGPWIKKGVNEVVVLDLTGPDTPVVLGQTTPILDELRLDRDLPKPKSNRTLALANTSPTHSGAFRQGSNSQDVMFETPAKGRQFCLVSQNAHDQKGFAAVAEIALLDKAGQPINQSDWSVAYVDSEEVASLNGAAVNAINGQAADFWHTAVRSADVRDHPHYLAIDLGRTIEVAGFRYTPRQGGDGVTGRIKDYQVYVGDALVVEP